MIRLFRFLVLAVVVAAGSVEAQSSRKPGKDADSFDVDGRTKGKIKSYKPVPQWADVEAKMPANISDDAYRLLAHDFFEEVLWPAMKRRGFYDTEQNESRRLFEKHVEESLKRRKAEQFKNRVNK